jgi:hypothetical protein
MTGTPDKITDEPRVGRISTNVHALSELVGAHPDALRTIYGEGRPADPLELGAAPRGRVLALAPGSGVYMLTRPLLRALASDVFPWRGKVFDHGGNSGRDVVFGKPVFRFHAEVAASEIDGKSTLVLRYVDPAFKNPWPVRAVVDELRSIGDGVALGNAFLEIGGSKRLLLWWGLEVGMAS